MARNITLTLGAGLGADLGPNFNLTADVGSVTPSTATKSELTAGKSVSVDDLATQVTVTSTGTCTNAITQTIPCVGQTTTSTTTTSTSTTTAAPSQVSIYIGNVLSLDIAITSMSINGVSVTWSGAGPDFPINAGDNGSFVSSETGIYDVSINYTTSIPGQNITFTDSDAAITCINTNGTAGNMYIASAKITAGTTIYVTATDGACS